MRDMLSPVSPAQMGNIGEMELGTGYGGKWGRMQHAERYIYGFFLYCFNLFIVF